MIDKTWDETWKLLLELAQNLITINTANPPGNELPAMRAIGALLETNGLESRIWESAPNRGNLYAVLKGSGRKKPVVLMSHLDVVPARAGEWEMDPFGGAVKDGFLWGRGAIDMKGLAAIHIMNYLLLAREKKERSRDIILLAVADEEAGAKYGARAVIENHPEIMEAECLLTEGGHGQIIGGRPAYSCQVAEKGVYWLKLTASGPPGHGSMPHSRNCLARMIRTVREVLGQPTPLKISEAMDGYFNRLAEIFPDRTVYQNPLAEENRKVLAQMMEEDRGLYAQLHNTISPTMLHAGDKVNVIPSSCEAFLDCRLLPGEDPCAFLELIRQIAASYEVQMEIVENSPASSSQLDTELYRSMENAVRSEKPEAVLLPFLSAGATDSRYFRRQGMICYGFEPFLLGPEEISRMHGINERISLENLQQGMRIFWNLMDKLTD
ncbi:MAG: M20/M25/M40 family metallo-hydrolase [Bacillota bacterium]